LTECAATCRFFRPACCPSTAADTTERARLESKSGNKAALQMSAEWVESGRLSVGKSVKYLYILTKKRRIGRQKLAIRRIQETRVRKAMPGP
jgi:hypothetical protein